jgi:hypothetical protein
MLADRSTGATYISRVVAIRDGDSTSFRYSVEMALPPRASEQPADSTAPAPDDIEFCGEIAHAAAIRWSRPARRPNADDSLDVWTHVSQ